MYVKLYIKTETVTLWGWKKSPEFSGFYKPKFQKKGMNRGKNDKTEQDNIILFLYYINL